MMMKKNVLKMMMVFFAIFAFNACSEDNTIEFTTQAPPEQISFTNDFLSQYLLSEQTLENNAERFTWEAQDFGVQTVVTYELQGSIDVEFTEPLVLASTSNKQASVSVAQLFNLAETAGLDNDPDTDNMDTGDLFIRVKAFLGNGENGNSPATVSDVSTLTVVLLAAAGDEPVVLPNLYLVGNATAADWNNDNNNFPLVRDPENPNVFSYTGKFLGNGNEFKLIESRGAWQPQWGIQDGGFETSEDLGGDPGAFSVSGSDGYYTLEVDTENKTSNFVPFDESTSATYGSVGIIGFGTTGSDEGWNQDIDMTQSSFDPHVWYISEIQLFDGEVKFRTDDSWDINWGANTEFSGFGTFGGPNIPVSEGTYEVWLNDLNGTYMLIPLQ